MPSHRIRRLGHLGDGITDGDAGDIYVPFSLPGEVVEGEVVNGHMAALRILEPVAERVKPPCSHFKSCGGCALQHASDDFLAHWKADIAIQALAAQGIEVQIPPALTSPANSRRRATLAGRRTKKGALVGFYARASDVIVPIPGCTLLHRDILAALPALEELTRLSATRKQGVGLAVTQSDNGLDVDIRNERLADGVLAARLAQFSDSAGFARLSWNGEVLALSRPPQQSFGSAKVTPPPGGFLQATHEGQAALTDLVLEAVGPARRVADLFSGCGTFSLPLAQGAEVSAFESDAEALRALTQGWRSTTGLKPVTTETRDLFRRPVLSTELNRFDAVVLDPPRAGAAAQVAELAASKLASIAYVSCNPATFARDAVTLAKGGYSLDWVRVVDQFRWAAHVELVAKFSRS